MLGGAALHFGKRMAEVSMTTESSWQQIRAKFLQGAEEHPDLYAHWDGSQEIWTLRLARAHQAFQPATPESERLFVETARMAVQLLKTLGEPDTMAPASPLGRPWHVWLDLMRRQKRGFRKIEKPRRWTQFRNAVVLKAPVSTDSKDGGIRHVFKVSADFCADLDLGGAEAPASTGELAASPQGNQAPAQRIDVGCARRFADIGC